MNDAARKLRAIACSLIAAGPLAAAIASPPEYAIIELREVPSREVYVRGLNNRGEVCGTIFTIELGLRGFIWSDGSVRVLNAVEDTTRAQIDARGMAINDGGQVAGESGLAFGMRRATRWTENRAENLGALAPGASVGYALNSLGHVAGASGNTFLWRDGQMIDLGAFPNGGSGGGIAWAVNDSDEVVGYSFYPGAQQRAFLWTEGEGMIDLSTPEERFLQALDINDSTQIVGYLITEFGPNACLWENGQIRNLHQTTPLRDFGLWSTTTAINENGLILGGAEVYGRFLWDEVRGLRDLEDMLPPNHGWELDTYAFTVDINDAEQIAMYGDRFGRQPGALLTPVEATLTLDPPSPGTADSINTFTVRGCTPGERLTFVYGTIGGGAKVPGCALQSKAVFQMDDPITFGTATADPNGTATITRFVPEGARNMGEVLIQAVQTEGCRISQLVVHQFD